MKISNSKIYKTLDPHFVEIKELIISHSTALVAEELNRKYQCNISERDLNNYLHNMKDGFNIVAYRKSSRIFNFNKAKTEDESKQFQPRFK